MGRMGGGFVGDEGFFFFFLFPVWMVGKKGYEWGFVCLFGGSFVG